MVVVRDGDEALDYLFMRNGFADRAEGNPALIMLDIKLNKMSGLGVLESLRKVGGPTIHSRGDADQFEGTL